MRQPCPCLASTSRFNFPAVDFSRANGRQRRSRVAVVCIRGESGNRIIASCCQRRQPLMHSGSGSGMHESRTCMSVPRLLLLSLPPNECKQQNNIRNFSGSSFTQTDMMQAHRHPHRPLLPFSLLTPFLLLEVRVS